MEKGLFLFEEILQDKRLNMYEKWILSYYKGLSLEFGYPITDEGISDYLKISLSTFKRAKKHLKELGLIEPYKYNRRIYIFHK